MWHQPAPICIASSYPTLDLSSLLGTARPQHLVNQISLFGATKDIEHSKFVGFSAFSIFLNEIDLFDRTLKIKIDFKRVRHSRFHYQVAWSK